MRKIIQKRFLATALVVVMAASALAGCSSKADDKKSGTENESTTENRPDTWIADRTITIQAYVDDIGNNLPQDLNSTPVMQEITKRTGIKLDIQYTPGDSDASVMAAQMASGTIPDVIISYLDNSTRPEFPILLKAAREEMFADVSSLLPDTKVYKRYLEDGYLPDDAKKNITFREEFNGAAYILPLYISAEDRTLEYNPQDAFVGGMYIQKSIVDALGIDPTQVKTQEDFYNLLVKIKDGGFKDDNGNDVYALGPKFWGGSVDTLKYIVPGYTWGVSDGYNITEDGTIMHEADTDYVFDKINYVRKLLADGLMNPEFFTMDPTRAEEVSRSHNSAIIADVHNYQDIVYTSDEWIPLGPLNDFTGDNSRIVHGKTQNGAWAISSEAENPKEILDFFDYLASPEGQILSEYGVEGVSYTMVDGKPQVTEDVLNMINNGEKEALVNNIGAGFGNAGFNFFNFIQTNVDNLVNFGESRPGAASSETFNRSVEIATEYPVKLKLVPGLDATAYLSADSLTEVKSNMALLNYNEMLVQAIYASSDSEVKDIVESFRAQLKVAGNDEFIAYLTDLYKSDSSAIDFYNK